MSNISNKFDATLAKPSDPARFTVAGGTPEEQQLLEVASVLPEDLDSRARLDQIIQQNTARTQRLGGAAWREMSSLLPADDCDVSEVDIDPYSDSPEVNFNFQKLAAAVYLKSGHLSEEDFTKLSGINGRDELGLA